jgi:hypothetical protein
MRIISGNPCGNHGGIAHIWGETAQGYAYRLVSALYTREAVSTWLRVYRPEYPAGQPLQVAEAEYREALVGAMEVVAQKPWPPIRQWRQRERAQSTPRRSRALSRDRSSTPCSDRGICPARAPRVYVSSVRLGPTLRTIMPGVTDIPQARAYPETPAPTSAPTQDYNRASGVAWMCSCKFSTNEALIALDTQRQAALSARECLAPRDQFWNSGNCR